MRLPYEIRDGVDLDSLRLQETYSGALEMARYTTPGQLPRMRTEEVASVEINLPPLDEQRKISLQISKRLNNTNSLISTLESQLAETESLPASLLREAFAGQG